MDVRGGRGGNGGRGEDGQPGERGGDGAHATESEDAKVCIMIFFLHNMSSSIDADHAVLVFGIYVGIKNIQCVQATGGYRTAIYLATKLLSRISIGQFPLWTEEHTDTDRVLTSHRTAAKEAMVETEAMVPAAPMAAMQALF